MKSFRLLLLCGVISFCFRCSFSFSPLCGNKENRDRGAKYKELNGFPLLKFQTVYRCDKDGLSGKDFILKAQEDGNANHESDEETIIRSDNLDVNEQWIISAAKKFSNESNFLNQAMGGQGSLSTLPQENNELLEYKPLANYDEMIAWAKEKDRLIDEDKVPGLGGTNAEMRSLFHLYDSTKHPHTYRELDDSEAAILTSLADLIKKRVKSSQVLPLDDAMQLKTCLHEVETIMERDATHLRKTEFLLNRDKLRGRGFFPSGSSPSSTASFRTDVNSRNNKPRTMTGQEQRLMRNSNDFSTNQRNAATSPFETNNRVDNPDFDPIYGSVEVRDKLYEFVYSLLVERRPDYMRNKAGYTTDESSRE